MVSPKDSPFHRPQVLEPEKVVRWASKNRGQTIYSAVYADPDTWSLDKIFMMDYTTVVKGSMRDKALDRAVELSALGNTDVERLLRYFVERAKAYCIFVGLPEQEVRHQLRTDRRLSSELRLREEFIDRALLYQDPRWNGATVTPTSYLKRVNARGIDVLFPMNLSRR